MLYLKGIVEFRTCNVVDPMISESLLSYFKGLNPYDSGKLKQQQNQVKLILISVSFTLEVSNVNLKLEFELKQVQDHLRNSTEIQFQ